MTLANGRPYLAIPGPSTMPDRVLAGHAPGRAEHLCRGAARYGRHALARPEGGGGHLGPCRALHRQWPCGVGGSEHQSLLARRPGARACLGSFRHRLGEFRACPGDRGRPAGLRRTPRSTSPGSRPRCAPTRATLSAPCWSRRSIRPAPSVPISRLCGRVLDATGHPALLAVDCIASLGCDEYRMDDWGVDVTVAASQKGLMTPPGLAFVWFSPRAAEVCRNADLRTPYWNWTPRATGTEFWQYLLRHRPHASPLWPARGARHDRRGKAARDLGAARDAGPRGLGRVRCLGAGQRGHRAERGRRRTPGPLRHLGPPWRAGRHAAEGVDGARGRGDAWHRPWHVDAARIRAATVSCAWRIWGM